MHFLWLPFFVVVALPDSFSVVAGKLWHALWKKAAFYFPCTNIIPMDFIITQGQKGGLANHQRQLSQVEVMLSFWDVQDLLSAHDLA